MSRKKITPVLFHKVRLSKEQRSPILYGWYHNAPWSKYNNYAYFWSENRPIRKTVVNHAQRVRQVRTFGMHFDSSPSVMQELSQQGPFTLFCPTNDAMDMILDSAWDKLWDEERAKFLRHHAIKGRWGIADLAAAGAVAASASGSGGGAGSSAAGARIARPPLGRESLGRSAEGPALRSPLWTLADQPLPVEVEGRLEDLNRVVRVGGAAVTKSNVRCWNGYVHLIDRPLVPQWR